MRSLLFVPGGSDRMFAKALDSGADALIIDLEDSVAPAAKPAARELAGEQLRSAARATPTIFVRVNDLRTGLIETDLDAVMPFAPSGIMLPKAEGADDVAALADLLGRHEVAHGLACGATRIIAIATETPAGVLAAASYRRSHPRLAGLAWGAEDLSSAMGALSPRDAGGAYTEPFRFARTMALYGAAAAGVAAIEAVHVDFRDLDGLRHACREGLRDGFSACLAIHPAQIPVINAVFTPSAADIECARAIVEAFAAAGNPGVLAIDGKMLDRPHLRQATRLLARAGQAVSDTASG